LVVILQLACCKTPFEQAVKDWGKDASAIDKLGPHPGAPVVVQRLQGQDVMKLLLDYSPADLLAGPASFDVTVHKKGSSDARTASVPLVVQ